MGIFGTTNGLENIESHIKDFPSENRKISSTLFEGNPYLIGINQSNFAPLGRGREGDDVYNNIVPLIRRALRIILPELAGISAGAKQRALDLKIDETVYNVEVESLVKVYQELKITLEVDGVIGPETLLQLDDDLNRIKIYDVEKGKTVFNIGKAQPTDMYSVVTTKTYLYKEPLATEENKLYPLLVVPYKDSAENEKLIQAVDENEFNPERNFKDNFIREVHNTIHPNNFDLKVGHQLHIIARGGTTAPGWLYVVTRPSKDLFKEHDVLTEDDKALRRNLGKNVKGIHGYVRETDVWPVWEPNKLNMPDPDSLLYKIPQQISAQELIRDIVFGYYFNKDAKLEPYQYRFYANAILYANNPKGVRQNQDGAFERAIYPVKNGNDIQDEITREQEAIAIRDIYDVAPNSDQEGKGYQRFLSFLRDQNEDGVWDFLSFFDSKVTFTQNYNELPFELDDAIAHSDNYRLWIPSRTFMDNLFAKVQNDNLNDSGLVPMANMIRQLAKFIPRGLGSSIELSAGITPIIPIGTDFEGKSYLYRKNTQSDDEVVFVLRNYGQVTTGLELYAGASVSIGRRSGAGARSNDNEAALGGHLDAEFSAKAKLRLVSEYEFPLENEDYGAIVFLHTLFKPLIDMLIIDSYTEFLDPLVLFKLPSTLAYAAFRSYMAKYAINLDPDNYLTYCKFEVGGFIEGSAGAGLTVVPSTFLTEEFSNPSAENRGDIGSRLGFFNFLQLLNLKASGNIRLETNMGVEYSAVYGNESLIKRKNFRTPLSADLTIYVNAGGAIGAVSNILANSAQLFPGRSIPDLLITGLQGGIEGRIGIKPIRARLSFRENQSTSGIPIYSAVVVADDIKLKDPVVYFESGEFDYWLASASEYGIKVNLEEFPTSFDDVNGETLVELFHTLTVKKREWGGVKFPFLAHNKEVSDNSNEALKRREGSLKEREFRDVVLGSKKTNLKRKEMAFTFFDMGTFLDYQYELNFKSLGTFLKAYLRLIEIYAYTLLNESQAKAAIKIRDILKDDNLSKLTLLADEDPAVPETAPHENYNQSITKKYYERLLVLTEAELAAISKPQGFNYIRDVIIRAIQIISDGKTGAVLVDLKDLFFQMLIDVQKIINLEVSYQVYANLSISGQLRLGAELAEGRLAFGFGRGIFYNWDIIRKGDSQTWILDKVLGREFIYETQAQIEEDSGSNQDDPNKGFRVSPTPNFKEVFKISQSSTTKIV